MTEIISFPSQGSDAAAVAAALEDLKAQDADWARGRTFSLVYALDESHQQVLLDAHRRFAMANALSPSAFPSLATMEREVVAMSLDLLHGDPKTSGGTMASGGTESIILAMKAHRDRARATGQVAKDATAGIVAPTTIHPAHVKAAELLGMSITLVDLGDDLRADPDAIAAAVGKDTAVLAGSAPCFPYGVVDPIEELGAIALQRGIGLHVDACLGGFVLPFLEDLGHDIPPFDFRTPGVTSMSTDLHKYAFGPKGTSTILYADRTLRRHQFTADIGWPGGILASPTLLGTRSGGAIAGAWAALRHQGRAGYQRIFTGVMDATRRLQEGIVAAGPFQVLAEPVMSVFAFGSDELAIFDVADHLGTRGWSVDRQQDPDCLHLIVNPTHVPVVDEFLADLGEAARQARPAAEAGDQRALYGVTTRIDVGDDVMGSVLDGLESRYDLPVDQETAG